MGTSKSNLGKISKLSCGNDSTRWILVAIFALVLSVELANSSEETDSTTTTPQTSPTQPYPSENIILDFAKVEEPWKLKSDSKPTVFKISEEAQNAGFKIAIHLQKCDFGGDESIKITSTGRNEEWFCSPQRDNTISSIEPEYIFMGTDMQMRNDKYSGDVTVLKVMDGIDEVEIVPNWNHSGRNWKGKEKATIIVNLYKGMLPK